MSTFRVEPRFMMLSVGLLLLSVQALGACGTPADTPECQASTSPLSINDRSMLDADWLSRALTGSVANLSASTKGSYRRLVIKLADATAATVQQRSEACYLFPGSESNVSFDFEWERRIPEGGTVEESPAIIEERNDGRYVYTLKNWQNVPAGAKSVFGSTGSFSGLKLSNFVHTGGQQLSLLRDTSRFFFGYAVRFNRSGSAEEELKYDAQSFKVKATW